MIVEGERVAGVLLGLAAGDSIGGPAQMAVRLAESLSDNQYFNVDDIGSRYLAWWREGAFDTGPTTAAVLRLVASGRTFQEAAWQVDAETRGLTAGCNPAHRATPLAMLFVLSDEELANSAKVEAALTHRHPLAGDVSAAAVILCRALIRGYSWAEAIKMSKVGRQEETQAALGGQSLTSLKRDGFAPHVLAAAVYFVANNPDFDTMLHQALEFAGPPNYCPVLAGSLGGARWGASSIHSDWLRGNDLTPRVQKVADNLAGTWY